MAEPEKEVGRRELIVPSAVKEINPSSESCGHSWITSRICKICELRDDYGLEEFV